MKTLITFLTASTLSLSAFAFDNSNPDLYGWVVNDKTMSGHQGNLQAGTNDLYGHVMFDKTPVFDASPAEVGIGDSYGSILNDIIEL